MNLLQFLLGNHRELSDLIMEHLFLVIISMGIAILIGVPLGILLTRRPNLSKPVLGFANIMQTVPSLALFGFLIPLNIYLFHVRILGGIGARTAIVALVLYALLPIIRNTFIGISGVDPAIREAGRGMGMTDRQLLFQVELPLALGVIIAGIRVATVICVGTATIAAAIDAGGLGRYIFRGLRMNDNVLILAGAVPVAPNVPLVVTEGNYLLLPDPPWSGVRPLLDEVWFLAPPEPDRQRWLVERHRAHGRTPDAARDRTFGSDQANAERVNATADRADLVLRKIP